MSDTYQYAGGRTKPIIHQLLRRPPGQKTPTPFDATGTSIALRLVNQAGATITTSGNVTWENATESKAKYTPDAGDLVPGDTLTAHWVITDGTEVFHCPEGPGDTWEIA